MAHRVRHVLGSSLLLLLACGGAESGDTSTPPAQQSPTAGSDTSGDPVRLSELLFPLDQPKSREQLVQIAAFIRVWERDPFGTYTENDTGRGNNFVMLAWLSASPDITVSICPFLSQMAGEGQGEAAQGAQSALTIGSTFGMAAYMIENPGATPEAIETQVAGVESAARWYEAQVARGQVERNAFADQLIAERDRNGGSLRPWYEASGIRCGGGS